MHVLLHKAAYIPAVILLAQSQQQNQQNEV